MIKGLASKLKKKRQELNLSRKMVAENIGVSASVIADYESGYGEPSLKVLMKLATLYKCSTDYLLGIEKGTPTQTIDVSALTPDQIQALQSLIDTM
ncbi:MAG: helix-turn-helix transcriptional regulator [Lachnospiraceae bacterium]|jgi:transcriptional regulator with XRE-family HTH domain|nr:helix-turn-helix domain-containing protein [Lachnospiraceae bacterium]MDD7326735.1 helix-turn-helix transcriptional regulator [Lachnospiraceae bacterium]MDY2758893.1 helix-turn-helix transcriptional regulator [Lachnospiraceae bacterium]